MTDVTLPFVPPLETGGGSYLDEGHTIMSWLTTTDHKRIAILYALSITVFFFMGGIAIGLVRLELVSPTGLFLTSDEYNRLFTIHGIIMVWFFLVPSIPATMGNFILPMMIGAPDVAFPRLNLLSWYLYVGGAAFTVYAVIAGGVDTGWTFYPPFSSQFSHSDVIPAAAGVFVVGFSSIATGVNFLATIHMLRCPGMTWFRLPLFAWSMYVVSMVMVLATPVLAMSLLLTLGRTIFRPADFRCGRRRRSNSVSASVLVLQPSRRLHHDPAGDGRRVRSIRMLRAAPGVRLRIHGDRATDHRRNRLHGVGPSHVRRRTIAARQPRLLVPVIHCRGAIGDQGVQLDGHALSRPYRLRGADGLRARLPRIVHYRRTDRPVSRFSAGRRGDDGYLLRRRAFPHHHGRRNCVGLHGRHSLLVAEGHRQTLQRILGAVRRHHHVPRLQRNFLAAIRHGLARHAAALPLLSRRFSDLAHSLERRRRDTRRRLSDAAGLSRLVALHSAQRRRTIPGTRPAWNGRRLRRRRNKISSDRRGSTPTHTTITTSAARKKPATRRAPARKEYSR